MKEKSLEELIKGFEESENAIRGKFVEMGRKGQVKSTRNKKFKKSIDSLSGYDYNGVKGGELNG